MRSGGFTTPRTVSQRVSPMLNRIFKRKSQLAVVFALGTCLGLSSLGGCQRKERVVDVRTPAGDVTVDRNVDNGDVEVKTDTD